ncbi:MAG TPA: hypothetical protein VNS60_07570 [Solirubrobacterales bacterium]|nr:hypothetical protein [Solirubrobacterales bacterium]
MGSSRLAAVESAVLTFGDNTMADITAADDRESGYRANEEFRTRIQTVEREIEQGNGDRHHEH